MNKLTSAISLLLAVSPLSAQCIGSVGITNDASLIQAKLDSGQTAVLCPSTVWAVNQTITFPIQYDDIYVYTLGNPRDDTRALLYVNNSSIAAAFAANGWDVQNGTVIAPDNVQLRNLRIDGGIDRLGSCSGQPCYNQALIYFGGPTSGQIVDSVKAWGARGWSTLVFERGASAYHNGCNAGQITNNDLGPSGRFATGQYADGISLQCSNSDVLYNLIQDVTDGGIVIFGAPGSTIRYNDIRANTQSAISGIAMVDQWGTNDGNFSGTQVFGNTITANAFMKFGIAMGRKLFCEPNVDLYNWGGSVTGNILAGSQMGYGYVADGVTNWTVTGNVDHSLHVGTPVSQCDCTLPSPQSGFIRHMGAHTDSSTLFQAEFTNGCLHGADIHR
jgi:hypothetical protein